MSRYIDIEPYEKDGWYMQKNYYNTYDAGIKIMSLISIPTAEVEPTYEQIKDFCDKSGLVLVNKDLWFSMVMELQARKIVRRKDCKIDGESVVYCDRNLCTLNEYNGVNCDECQSKRMDGAGND